MSSGVRLPYRVAETVADRLVDRLRPGCERIEVAGSLRRGAADVGDIELVVIPRIRTEVDQSVLFGGDIEVSALEERLAEMAGDLVPRLPPANGPRHKRLADVETGIPVDLFVVSPPAQWGAILLIRTGPADYSRRVVTDAHGRGFHFAAGALRPGGLGHVAGSRDDCRHEVIPTPEEEDVLRVLGMPWRAPADRR